MNIRPVVSLVLAAICLALAASAAAEPELVNIKAVDPTILVELRYATDRNITGRPIYPRKMPALIRPSVAARLFSAQNYLQVRGFRLKVWDAYRPKFAHDQLWRYQPNKDYVADPAQGMALHTWGVAVDATLAYLNGHEVAMPTDFDVFTPAAMLRYTGQNPNVREHLHLLQRAMAQAGFYGMRTEWWHFIAKDWQQYGPVETLVSANGEVTILGSSPPPTASTPATPPLRATPVTPAPRTDAARAAATGTPGGARSSF